MTALPRTRDALLQAIMIACAENDVSRVSDCIGVAPSFEPKDLVKRLMPRCLSNAVINGFTEVISYSIAQGADVTRIRGGLLSGGPSPPAIETLEVLVANGWDINSHSGVDGEPVLWHVVEYPHLVEWCLDHGASVDPPDDTPPGFVGRMPVLDRAAALADIATFELLRAKGAPVCYDYGVLPRAVTAATDCVPRFGESPSANFLSRVDMVHRLLDKVGCDVNSKSNGPYRSGSVCSTPLCWIACHKRKLIWLLPRR